MAQFDEYTWIMVCSVFLALFVAWGIGANDVGNAFGSSVGARALTIKQAILVAAICEFTGAFLMGAGVTDTIRGGIADLNAYIYKPELLMYGMMCALLAAGIWLALATFLELPVSTTHSIVGAIVGMSCAAQGFDSVTWSRKTDSFPFLGGMSSIVLSWVFSPILTGVIAVILFLFTRHAVLRRKNSFELSLWLLPFYAFLTFFVVTYFIIKKGGQAFGWQKTPDSKAAWISAVTGACACVLAAMFGPKYIRYRVEQDFADDTDVEGKVAAKGDLDQASGSDDGKPMGVGAAAVANRPPMRTPQMLVDMRRSRVWKTLTEGMNTDIHAVAEGPNADAKIHDIHEHSERFDEKTELSFKYLQVCTACANSFAHGSNDVANAMGPFAAVYAIWQCACVGSKSSVPQWILAVGGFGIVVGLATYGHIIMRVLGVKMTRLTNSRGYCVELAAAAVVILASRYGLPVSTTHCMVGAVTAIGMLEGRRGFNFTLLLRFFLGWIATLVVAALTSALFTLQGLGAPSVRLTDWRANMNAAFNETTVGAANTLIAAGNVTAPTPAQAAAVAAGEGLMAATKVTWASNGAAMLNVETYTAMFQNATFLLGNATLANVTTDAFMPEIPMVDGSY